jgi:hypothetical protein
MVISDNWRNLRNIFLDIFLVIPIQSKFIYSPLEIILKNTPSHSPSHKNLTENSIVTFTVMVYPI